MYLQSSGVNTTPSLNSLMSSTLAFDAASISIISANESLSAFLQISHSRQGSPFLGLRQFIALAKILAQVVFPVPLEPVNKYA